MSVAGFHGVLSGGSFPFAGSYKGAEALSSLSRGPCKGSFKGSEFFSSKCVGNFKGSESLSSKWVGNFKGSFEGVHFKGSESLTHFEDKDSDPLIESHTCRGLVETGPDLELTARGSAHSALGATRGGACLRSAPHDAPGARPTTERELPAAAVRAADTRAPSPSRPRRARPRSSHPPRVETTSLATRQSLRTAADLSA